MSARRAITKTSDAPRGWDDQLSEVARSLPAVLAGLHASYRALEERATRIERELVEKNRELTAARGERDELAERLHAADKLSALGTMAAGIAHEIRNPLNGVRGFAELLSERERSDERAAHWAQRIVDGVHEVDLIIENLLSFGSPQRLRLEAIDGHELLAGAARLAEAELVHRDAEPHSIESHSVESHSIQAHSIVPHSIQVHCDAPPFRGDRIKLRQAVRNLIENALEAQADARPARVDVQLTREGDALVWRVSDAGPGVPAELRARILDPFFTTHADGTGLGLALVSVIARLHGGTVQCSPRPSALGGALFVLRIPFQPAERPAVPETQRS